MWFHIPLMGWLSLKSDVLDHKSEYARLKYETESFWKNALQTNW